jgi:hypothetical protein
LEEVMVERQFATYQTHRETNWLAMFLARFIQEQKDRFSVCCKPLRAQHLERMAPYFSAQDLARVRFANIYPDRVPNPGFYTALQAAGLMNLPDLARRKASTFDQFIVTHEPFTPALLFHELVVVVQYRLLGVEGFARSYVQALLNGNAYGSTPLEDCAQALQARFEAGSLPINVEEEIKQWLAAERLISPAKTPSSNRSWSGALFLKLNTYTAFCRPIIRAGRSGWVQ